MNGDSLESMQLQSMRNEGLEIGGIGGGEFCDLCIEREDAAGEKTLHKMGSVLGNAHFYVAYFPVMHKLSAWLDRYALNMLVPHIT